MKIIDRSLYADFRVVTSPIRVCPDFIIVGEAKCGTTSAYHYIGQHPDVFSAIKKEPRNFIEYPNSIAQCRRHYPTIIRKALHRGIGGSRFVAGEATAEYFANRHVPGVLSRLLPKVKIIVMLRHPSARALSDYQMFKNQKLVDESFEVIVDRSIRWLSNDDVYPWLLDAGQYEHSTIRFVLRGIYFEPAQRWIKHFAKEQMLFVCSEDFFSETGETAERIFRFLGLDDHRVEKLDVQRKGCYEWGAHKQALGKLDNFYSAHNEKLYALLGQDYGWHDAKKAAAAVYRDE